MSKLVFDIRKENEKKYKTYNNTFDDFPIGTKVKIITPMEDFNFFHEETGKVKKNSGYYLGIIVKFDKPRHFKGGIVQKEFNFNPTSLQILDKKITKKDKKEIIVENTVEKMDFDSLIVFADIFDVEHEEKTWLDDEWPYKEDELRARVAEAMTIYKRDKK